MASYHDELVECVKAAGQELIDEAEDLVGPEIPGQYNLEIVLSFKTNTDEITIPTIGVYRELYSMNCVPIKMNHGK